MHNSPRTPLVAIACGGTGGHLFPGLAIAEALQEQNLDTLLLVSPKEVDQHAVRGLAGAAVATLPAVPLARGQFTAGLAGCWRSFRAVRRLFRQRRPAAVLAMGSFTSVPPVLAGKLGGARTFLHEANSIPGRANRWLAHLVDQAFVYFDSAAERLWTQHVRTVGMPVRAPFQAADPAACRSALGMNPEAPVLVVTGGSQGAHAINELVTRTLPALALLEPRLQFIHLTGTQDVEFVKRAYAAQRRPAVVRPFLTEMELALGAASVVISRAGASSLAEIAAMRLPSILIPYPSAADNHQFHNAKAFAETGAARMLVQGEATPEKLLWEIRPLLRDAQVRIAISAALGRWHYPQAARTIADAIVASLGFEPTGVAPGPELAALPATPRAPALPLRAAKTPLP